MVKDDLRGKVVEGFLQHRQLAREGAGWVVCGSCGGCLDGKEAEQQQAAAAPMIPNRLQNE